METKKLENCTIGELVNLCDRSDCLKCPLQYIEQDTSHKICAAILLIARNAEIGRTDINVVEEGQ